MSFFARLFKSDPVGAVKKAFQQKQYAEVLSKAQSLDMDKLEPLVRQEVEEVLSAAGDALARINFEEGEAFLRAGDRERAADHFVLASTQVRLESLRKKIEEGLQRASAVTPAKATGSSHGCCSGSCQVSPGTAGLPDDSELSADEEFELILAGYPMEWAEKYIDLDPSFVEGFLFSHRGENERALSLFEQVPAESYNALFFFERGSVHGRLGNIKKAFSDLRKCLDLEPENHVALETLIQLERAANQADQSEQRLRGLLESGFDPAFCHAHLAAIFAMRQSSDMALEHGLKAVHSGSKDPEVILLTASLLESRERLGEAEVILGKIQGGGCGGVNIPLAEFWLRHQKNLDKALESFKKAAAHEPQNLRWPFRMAESYLAKGWKREGETILSKLLQSEHLDPHLAQKGRQYLSGEEAGGEK